MILAASHSLFAEGVSTDITLTLVGVLVGLALIVLADRLLSAAGGVEVADLRSAGVAKALLILGIMTAHSFAEGVDVGVPYAGSEGPGAYITTSIAFHNKPEGLDIAQFLVTRGSTVWKAALWAIFTSLPQPIMAAPAYLFVGTIRPFLPVGLAVGAMIWMVFSKHHLDATEKVGGRSATTAVTLAFSAMMASQMLVLSH